jgi:HEAT repeat protein
MAVQALGLIGDEKAIEPLIYALNDGDRNPKYQLDRRLVNLAIENIEQKNYR